MLQVSRIDHEGTYMIYHHDEGWQSCIYGYILIGISSQFQASENCRGGAPGVEVAEEKCQIHDSRDT